MALSVNQLTRGSASGVALFSTASVSAGAGRLVVIDVFFQPASGPIAILPVVAGLGGAWTRADAAGDLFDTCQRWYIDLGAGATSTIDFSWAGTNADVLWSVMEISGFVPGAPFVQTDKSNTNSVTLAPFSTVGNECLASWEAFYFPAPTGVPDPTMVQVGTPATLNVGAIYEMVSGVGPEEGDNAYSITWAGSFQRRAVASEINVAPLSASEALMFGNNF